jgi:ATP/maltotriose-dependent transcriptional regulator MalT/two-component SAPR family response regulator
MGHLFAAKLLVPQRPAVAIQRRALLARLSATPKAGLALLRAPAGYGKTALLTDLTNESRAAVAWLSLDGWDRDPAVFLSYLRAGVERAQGRTAPPADASLGDPREQLAEIAAVLEDAGSDVDIVLDDLHELDGAEGVLELLDYLAQRLPQRCRVFVASRSALALDCWPKLSAGGHTVELTGDDLLMTADEIRAVWREAGAWPLEPAFLDRLMRATNGWPVAVAMLARSGDLPADDMHGRLSEYLFSEVISKLPSHLATFLEQTSVLELLNPRRCSAVTGQTESEITELLLSLPALNVPATVVTRQPPEIRLHPLVRDMLEQRLMAGEPETLRRGHLMAAQADLDEGDVGGALAHLAAAEEWVKLGSAIAEAAPKAYQEGRWHSIASWIALLPESQIFVNPEIGLWQARILVRLGQCDEALRVIAATGASAVGLSPAMGAALEAVRSAALRTGGEIGTAVRAGSEAKRLAFAANAPVEFVADARKELGLSLISQGAFEDGIEELKAALEMQQFRGDASDIAFLSGCLGSAYGGIGRLGESVAYLEHARQKFAALRNSKELSWVLNNLGVIYFFFGNIDKARSVLEECLVTARAGGHRRAEGFVLASLADIDRVLGETDQGRERYASVIGISEEVNDVTLGTLALAGLADLERRAGRRQEAETLARRAIASAESRMARSEEALARLTLARLARQRGDVEEALTESETALSLLGSEGVARDLGEALLCRAEVLIDLRSHRAELNTTLRRLDDVIARLGHGSFVLFSERAADILRYATARKISDSFRELRDRLEPESATGDQGSQYPPIDVSALGGFSVRLAGRIVDPAEWESEKSREMFLLLLASGRPLTRDEVVVALWPDAERKKATSVFHSTLHRTRRALYAKVIVEAGGWYSLQPEASFSSDVARFMELTASVDAGGPDAECKRLSDALALYDGPFAPSMFGEWAEERRQFLHSRFLEAGLRLGQLLRERHQYEAAAQAYEKVLAADSLNESAWYGLIVAHAALGGRTRGLRTYRRYEHLLESDLGEAASGRLAALYRQLREKHRAAS